MNQTQYPKKEVWNKRFTISILLINIVIFALYTVPMLISDTNGSESEIVGFLLIPIGFAIALHSAALLLIGIIDSLIIYFTKSSRSALAYFISIGLLFVLGIITSILLSSTITFL